MRQSAGTEQGINNLTSVEPANPNSLRLSNVFLEIMQVADIYDDENIRVNINEDGQVEDNSSDSNNPDASNDSNNSNNSNNNLSEQESNSQIQAIKNSKWRVEIPKIGINAPIKSGTTQDVLATAVGHFPETNKWNGNVALAGHNRGYNCNFFQNIKKLKVGDSIFYHTEKGVREYKVVVNKIIYQTDWTYIQDTEDNRITLITCVENMFEYRRCVQAVEIT